jgi:hypothetical protein
VVQIGQIMLTLPNAYSKVGLLAALPLSVGCACLGFWTMYCLIGESAAAFHKGALSVTLIVAAAGNSSSHMVRFTTSTVVVGA